jgi:hypothetical protein
LGILNFIRIKIARHNLFEVHKKIKRDRKNLSIDDAKSILLIYQLTDEISFRVVEEFLDSLLLKEIDVKVISFSNQKNIPSWFPKDSTHGIIVPRDVHWDLKPKNEYLTNVLTQKYDILIDLSLESRFPILYVAALCNASMKIGPYDEDNKDYFDLMIHITPDTTVEEQIKQMMHYVDMINQN